MEETDATRAVRRRVAAPAAMGEQGSNQALGIDISDESAGILVPPWRPRMNPEALDCMGRMCNCPEVCFQMTRDDAVLCDFCSPEIFADCGCAGADEGGWQPCCLHGQDGPALLRKEAAEEAAEDRRQQAAAEAAEERRARAADEPPSFVASCCVPMETDMMTAPPARAGRAAAQALNTVEAFVRAFNRPDAVRGAEGGAPCPFGAMSAPSCANLRPAVECERCEVGPEFDPELGIAPEFTAEVYDPELGIAPEFTEVRTGTGVHIIRDAAGAVIEWPWESRRCEPYSATQINFGMSPFHFREEGCLPTKSATFLPGGDFVGDVVTCEEMPLYDHAARYFAAPAPNPDPLGSMAADATVLAGLNAATSDGKGGENSTGVRAYKAFCRKYSRAVLRPIDPNAPLWVKLSEEQWSMRFISELIDDRTIAVDTAKGYFGAASKWHLRKSGIGFAAGVSMKRLGEMVKGLKKLRDGPPTQLRHGISPQQLRKGMDIVFPPGPSAENANIRAMLATMMQGLMRGREAGCEHTFDQEIDIARADIATAEKDRFAFFMRPAKNMRHRRGKTVPIVIGGGGNKIDACFEVRRMLELDPTPLGQAASTPMFRKPDGSAFTTDDIRNLVRQIVAAIGLNPEMFGAHSLRIGGATALFAAGADPIHIRTMGRWSSDCYRLYVRSCFEQTLAWTARIGSQVVHDVQGTYERQAQETEYY